MARNCEKKLVGLNRMLLEKHQKEEQEKRPKRPSLNTLHSASDVKKWIPGIKQEIGYCLQQLSGARQHKYPDYKIKEFEECVEELEKEYKRFVSKVYQLDPNTTGIPWQARGYVSKRKLAGSATCGPSIPKKICTAILDQEKCDKEVKIVTPENCLASTTVTKSPISCLGLDYPDSSDDETDKS
ncbi:uncharacterized protein LOC5509813 isoform X5 [Nematostella vectensis]|uniref:uncharacterized protein LOC5509813 isoform X5 n=1 Tax=Nematostella vectensis TaxID=45351 RepID=UPI0013902353|nr:uncharacterized protein LOC5509813 isoform X5 [Nematostella vectensis]